jgi:hypothetical protein
MFKRVTDDKKWFIDWIEQYSQFFESCNWYTFNFAHIEFENDKIMGGVEVTFVILGLGFRWRWNHTETEERKACTDAIEEIKGRRVP